MVSSQTEIDFGTGVETKSSITVSLVNVGDAPLTINDIRLSNTDNGIIFASNGCRSGTLLEPVEACAMTLEWEPTREGEVVDDIQIYHDGARGILVLPLRGTAEKPVNKDTKAIVMSASMSDKGLLRSIPQVSVDDVEGEDDFEVETQIVRAQQPQDITGVLDGFTITSLAPNRAIISGPGGSRVIFDNQESVIGGVLWGVNIRTSSVEFSSGDQRVLLLFDKSLSSINLDGGQSTSTDGDNDDN